ncbi:MAG: hypothetical protein KKG33_12170 [candidate division Zixibacteria bacterium]|nr:hypothetical protein [candidate division Zixibacteria bacterium]MBU1471659.1 hypothetical protein [candidate division Zixibacteria bacterium]MBU2626305.1 hypothetical protein [candidate division Zixibacteria bacterium]
MHGRVLLTAVLLLAVIAGSASVHAGDYIRLGRDSIPAWTDNVEIPFYLERTCPEPEEIMGLLNPFEFTSTGNVTWEYVRVKPSAICNNFNLCHCCAYAIFDGSPPDYLEILSVSMFIGLPVTSEIPYVTLVLHTGGGTGEICVDSVYVPPAGTWKWSQLTCGEGGAPNRPLFIAKDSSDANHPICITVFDALCGDADGSSGVDIDDVVYLIDYIFVSGPEPMPTYCIGDFDGTGQVDIDDVVWLIAYIFQGGQYPKLCCAK